MASSSSGVDFMTQYKTISSKLKKRFLRKPNVAEASEQFSQLAKQQEEQDFPQYAAFTYMALARCEQTIGNPAAETQALIDAARLFLKSENVNYDLKCPSFNEHLNSAINCYNHAVRIYLEQGHSSLAASLCLELGNALAKFEKISEASTYFQRGAELVKKSPLEYLNATSHLVSCCIELEDYDKALTILTDMARVVNQCGWDSAGNRIGAFTDYYVTCEVTRILLLLLLSPGPQRLSPEHSELLEKYAWESNTMSDRDACLGEELFLILQSLVMAHQANDVESIKILQSDLWPHLSAEQKDLMNTLVWTVIEKN